MRYRPWPIVILALLQLCMPVLMIYLAATFYSMGFFQYLKTVSYLRSSFESYSFVLFPVIAAISIFAVRKWSYPVFLATIVWSMYRDLTHWTMSSTVFPTEILVLTYVFNILVVSYLMLPAVWALYFNPKFAWWRSKPRFLLNHAGEIRDEKGFMDCRLVDISKGGALIESSWDLNAVKEVTLAFTYSGLRFLTKAKIAHRSKRGLMVFGYGLEFNDVDRSNSKALAQIVDSLKRLHMEQVPKKAQPKDGFFRWMIHVVSTGHGLVPSVPSPQKKKQKTEAEVNQRP